MILKYYIEEENVQSKFLI